MQICLPFILAGVLIRLFRKQEIPVRWLVLLAICSAGASGLLFLEFFREGHSRITAVARDPQADTAQTVQLEVEKENRRYPFALEVPGHLRTAAEKQQLLERQAAGLDEEILGENPGYEHIERDLTLPAWFEESGIRASWSCDHPDWIGRDGVLGSGIPAEGGQAVLKGTLYLDDEELEIERLLTVYPSKEQAAFLDRLQQSAIEKNAGKDRDIWELPDELDGSPLTWYRQKETRGMLLCFVLLLIAFLMPFVRRAKQEEQKVKRREALEKQYPGFVSSLHLYLSAGLSMRRIFERMALESREEDGRTGTASEIREEVRRTWAEIENGVSERDAWIRFGERCGVPAYRELALLLTQNRIHGGSRLSVLLEREAAAAFETRKRQARTEGEKASVRLIMPMGLMLVVVLALVMVPALLNL